MGGTPVSPYIMEDMSKSEVARLRAQIQNEWDAARLGLTGLSQGSSKHETITTHMERMGRLHEELRTIDAQADEYLISVMESGSDELARVAAEYLAVPSYFERLKREAGRGKA